MTPFKITAIVVDDEKPAREEIIELLRAYKAIHVLAVCKNAFEAKSEIERLKPDVIFLDITMPQKSGFDLLADLTLVPLVVFVTAYDAFAIRAFEEHALDYLLKPVVAERLAKTIERIRLMLDTEKTQNPLSKHLFIRDRGDFRLIKLGDIQMIESYGNYIRIHAKPNPVLLHPHTLKEALQFLPTTSFVRINHKQIINVGFVDSFSVTHSRQLKIILQHRAEPVFASTRKSAEVKAMLTNR